MFLVFMSDFLRTKERRFCGDPVLKTWHVSLAEERLGYGCFRYVRWQFQFHAPEKQTQINSFCEYLFFIWQWQFASQHQLQLHCIPASLAMSNLMLSLTWLLRYMYEMLCHQIDKISLMLTWKWHQLKNRISLIQLWPIFTVKNLLRSRSSAHTLTCINNQLNHNWQIFVQIPWQKWQIFIYIYNDMNFFLRQHTHSCQWGPLS